MYMFKNEHMTFESYYFTSKTSTITQNRISFKQLQKFEWKNRDDKQASLKIMFNIRSPFERSSWKD